MPMPLPREHALKIKWRYLERLITGGKTCEVRRNDRDYQCGDVLRFTKGAVYRFRVTHVLVLPSDDILDQWVVLSLHREQEKE